MLSSSMDAYLKTCFLFRFIVEVWFYSLHRFLNRGYEKLEEFEMLSEEKLRKKDEGWEKILEFENNRLDAFKVMVLTQYTYPA